ncbi:MAG: phage tail protein [Bacteroidetes bacterium]|nr:phage tail protein [Bacteroidota bacterium]
MEASIYPVSFYFQLSFGFNGANEEDAAFQEVSGISKSMEMEEITGGGENRFKYRLPKVSSSQNLILKRALVSKNSKLISWCTHTLDTGLAYSVVTKDVEVSLLDKDGNVYKTWTFYKAYPVKYSISDLKSNENGILLETIELAYTYFEIAKSKS